MTSMRRNHNFNFLQAQKTDAFLALNLWKMKGVRPHSLPFALRVLLGSSGHTISLRTAKWAFTKNKKQFKSQGEMPEASVVGILPYTQPTSRACWEVFLAGPALKTLCAGLDFHEKEDSTCSCQSLTPSSHPYCQKVFFYAQCNNLISTCKPQAGQNPLRKKKKKQA